MTHKCNKEDQINKIEVNLAEIVEKVRSIEKRLFGNGVKGILQKLDDASDYVTASKEREKLNAGIESWNRKKLLFWGSAIFIVLQIFLKIIELRFFGR